MSNQINLPHPEEWAAWKDHEVTKVFFEYIRKSREVVKEHMAQGVLEPSESIPKCKLAQEILDVQLQDIVDFLHE